MKDWNGIDGGIGLGLEFYDVDVKGRLKYS